MTADSRVLGAPVDELSVVLEVDVGDCKYNLINHEKVQDSQLAILVHMTYLLKYVNILSIYVETICHKRHIQYNI